MKVSFKLPKWMAFWVFYFRRVGECWYNAKCDLVYCQWEPVTCSLCRSAGGRADVTIPTAHTTI
jgi:hypothetical protein